MTVVTQGIISVTTYVLIKCWALQSEYFTGEGNLKKILNNPNIYVSRNISNIFGIKKTRMFSSWNTCNIKLCPLVSVEMESWPLCLGKPSNIQNIKLPHARVTEASARMALQIVLAELSLCTAEGNRNWGSVLSLADIEAVTGCWFLLMLCSYIKSTYLSTAHLHIFYSHIFSSNTHLMST